MATKLKKARKIKKPVMRPYPVINDYDPNDQFTVRAKNDKEAMFLALERLGWWVAEP
jgi:hypothetical protein